MKSLAVVGSGPAAFYTVLRVLKLVPDLKICMFEKQVFPYGLVRTGVAPDHPEVKTCIQRFETLGSHNQFKYFGNCEIGVDLPLELLTQNFDAVLLAHGASKPRKLGILNEQLNGVLNASDFVNFYNGHPDYQLLNRELLKAAEHATIIGNGNVALDITRLLMKPVSQLQYTDITSTALDVLSNCGLKKIDLVGRKGLLESRFTNKELRELLSLESCRMDPVLPASELSRKPDSRVNKKKLSILNDYKPVNSSRSWQLKFWMTPLQILGKTKVEGVLYKNMKTNEFVEEKTDLVITSLGLEPELLNGMEKLTSPNMGGNINGSYSGNVFVSGWAATGSQGVIASTMVNSNTVGEEIAEYLNTEVKDSKMKTGEIESYLRGVEYIDWNKWLEIDKLELERGAKSGKPREKILKF